MFGPDKSSGVHCGIFVSESATTFFSNQRNQGLYLLSMILDYDECASESESYCSDENAFCINHSGSFACECENGFINTGNTTVASCEGN